MKNTETMPLSGNELLNIFGGQDPDKPHGIFQWIGYSLAYLIDNFDAKAGGPRGYYPY